MTTVRMARCGCGKERPSSERDALAFFEDCGPGSTSANSCVCGYYECAHDPKHMAQPSGARARLTVVERGLCGGFTPRGDIGHDRYYCGCRGWD